MKLFYLFTDYFVGYALKIWPRPKKNSLVVFDRYYHDMLIDPRRYRFREPMWLARWIGKIIPQPDVWILLDAPAEIMHARKREVTFEETQRQRDAYLKFVSSMANAYVVDSSASPGDTVSAIKKIIQERQRS
ncbi:MAG: hypothetical protein HUU32_15995 [Calditrichaceae bacterium]|nr:hypothetical protein [Calditrichia bacterium]NUQ42890.1 hypothetical protein [Calditrichaceae bacterium]